MKDSPVKVNQEERIKAWMGMDLKQTNKKRNSKNNNTAFPFPWLGCGADCHLLVPLNFQVALILDVFHSLYNHNFLSLREAPTLFPFIFGAPKHHFPQHSCTFWKVSVHPGWKSVRARAKSKGQKMSGGWELWIPRGCRLAMGCLLGSATDCQAHPQLHRDA